MANESTSMTQQPAGGLQQAEETQAATVAPPVDIYENEDEILVVADFPGVPKDAVSIQLDRSELVIEGAQPLAGGDNPARPLVFSRTFRVPNTVNPDGVRAELSRGVLHVHLAKSEAAKPRRIQVTAS
jgi:HSP20 family molecular chaperone IbpA